MDTASTTLKDLKQKLGRHDDFDLTSLSAHLTLLPTLIPNGTDRNMLISVKMMSLGGINEKNIF